MSDHAPEDKGKKPYQKPLLRKLTLRADEVLAKNCKQTMAGGPTSVGCATPQCFNLRS